MGEKHRISTASLHVPEPQADRGSRSIRNPPLMHEGMRGNNVGMFGHSGAIRSARGCGQYYHSFFSMHPHYWHDCRMSKMNKAGIHRTQEFSDEPKLPQLSHLEPRSLYSDSRFDPFSLAYTKARWMDDCAPEPNESGFNTGNNEMERL